MWLFLFVVALIFLLYLSTKRCYEYWNKKDVVHPALVPILGNLAPVMCRKKAISELTQEWYTTFADHRYLGFYQFFSPILLLRDVELIKEITVKEFDSFHEHRTFATEDIDPLWAKCFVALNGGPWHDMRSILSPAFTSAKMKAMVPLIKDCASKFIEYFKRQKTPIIIDVKETFTRSINDVVASIIFSVSCNSLVDRENEFYLMGKDISDLSGLRVFRFMLYMISPFLMKVLKVGIFSKSTSNFFRKLIKEALDMRQQNKVVRPDLIHLLLEARKESEYGRAHRKLKNPITDEDITAQSVVFYLGGLETTSSLIAFAAYELAINSDVQKKLQEEIDLTLKNCNGELSFEILMEMKYLDMVITETLRKWPITPITDRMSSKPYIIKAELPGEKDVVLEEGSQVWIPIYSIHRDPNYYTNPELFDPERFNDENKQNIKPYTYIPFGSGPRNCIGSRFALLNAKLMLTSILSEFDIAKSEKMQVPLQLATNSIHLKAKNGIWVELKLRKQEL